MRTILLIAFHFPPIQSSSGLQRTLRFAQYLPEFGWKPIVLTVGAPLIDRSQATETDVSSAGYEVVRAPCFDASIHLSIRNYYPRFLALPDRWVSWKWFAIPIARHIMRKRSIDALWSTYPIASAHKIAGAIARSTSTPWIADFRDPMAQPGYPTNPRQKRAFEQVEALVAERANRLVFVTPSAQDVYRRRFPDRPAEHFLLLENGYDECTFAGLPPASAKRNHPLVLLHSGIVYPRERDPTALFKTIGRLARNGTIREGDFVLRFRAPVHTQFLRSVAEKQGVTTFIDIQPRIPYTDALEEMLSADALVVMQGANCGEQIPAKLYEYLRAQRPILPLTDPLGDTGKTLSALGYPMVTKLESEEQIAANLPGFLSALRANSLPVARHSEVDRYSRRALTRRLASILDATLAERGISHSVARNEQYSE